MKMLCVLLSCITHAGTIHLKHPRLAAVCRKLEVDFAHAMMGFDIRGGRSVPRIEGVVICEEFERYVMDAYWDEER